MIYEFTPQQDLHGYASPWPAGGGANQWDEEWELGTISNEGAPAPSTTQIRSENAIPVSAETKYYIVTSGAMTVHYYEVDDTYISNEAVSASKEITTPADCAYMLFTMANTYGTKYKHDIAINYPSTVTTYSPYANVCPVKVYNIPGLEGPIYGGTLDTNTGILTSKYSYKDLGALTYNYNSTYGFYIPGAQAAWGGAGQVGGKPADIYADVYSKEIAGTIAGGSTNNKIGLAANFYISDKRFTVPADLKAALNKVTLVFALATPVEIQLTQSQINELLAELGAARNFGSRTNMLNTWMKLAQGHPVSDEELHMLRPSMRLPDDVVLRPTFEDTPLPEPDPVPDVVDTPAAEPEENISESEES